MLVVFKAFLVFNVPNETLENTGATKIRAANLQSGLLANFNFSVAGNYLRICRLTFSPHLRGESGQKNHPGESLAKSSKIADTFLQIGRTDVLRKSSSVLIE